MLIFAGMAFHTLCLRHHFPCASTALMLPVGSLANCTTGHACVLMAIRSWVPSLETATSRTTPSSAPMKAETDLFLPLNGISSTQSIRVGQRLCSHTYRLVQQNTGLKQCQLTITATRNTKLSKSSKDDGAKRITGMSRAFDMEGVPKRVWFRLHRR